MKKVLLVSVILFLSCTQPIKSEKSSIECNQDPEYFLLRPEVENTFGYSHAVKICNQIKISGAVSMDDSAKPTAIGDMEQQMINCYADLKKILNHYNASFDDVVVENIFTTDMNSFLEVSSYRNKMAGQAISNLIMKYNIKRKVDKISNKINFIQNNKTSIRSKKTNQIINLIKNNKQISHKELLSSKYLNWNSKTKFDDYRKALLRSRNIEEIAFNSNKRLSGNRKYEWRSIYKYTID